MICFNGCHTPSRAERLQPLAVVEGSQAIDMSICFKVFSATMLSTSDPSLEPSVERTLLSRPFDLGALVPLRWCLPPPLTPLTSTEWQLHIDTSTLLLALMNRLVP